MFHALITNHFPTPGFLTKCVIRKFIFSNPVTPSSQMTKLPSLWRQKGFSISILALHPLALETQEARKTGVIVFHA